MPQDMLRYSLAIAMLVISFTTKAQDSAVYRPAPYAASSGNFVRTWNGIRPLGLTTPFSVAVSNTTARLSTNYFDGLGRIIQSVQKRGSLVTPAPGSTGPIAAFDLVKPRDYDPFGREVRDYLNYAALDTTGNFKMTPFSRQESFYNAAGSPIEGQGYTFFYGKTEFEADPRNRPLRVYGAGDSWVRSGAINNSSDRSIKTRYLANTLTDGVRMWNVVDADSIGSFGQYVSPGPYSAGALVKIIVEDEDGKQVIEFKDQQGKVLLKKVQVGSSRDNGINGSGYSGWACTYYIYDDLDQLRCVVQPRGVELLVTNAWNMGALNGVILREQCFRYEYDQRGRQIVKKVLGAEPVFLVYDYRDRLVMTQDGNLRTAGRWLYTTYENQLNRPVATGLVTLAGSFSFHRANAMNASLFPAYPQLAGISAGSVEELSRTYYDDYSWLAVNGNPFSATMDNQFAAPYLMQPSSSVFPYPEVTQQSQATRNKVTGMRTRVLGTNQYLFTIYYYDDKGRRIQERKQNIAGGVQIISEQFSFSGQLLVRVVRYHHPASRIAGTLETIVATRITYDELGRLIRIDKRINGATAWKQVALQEYDAIGQVERKRLGVQPNGVHRTSLNYDYNIRGWLLGINRSYLTQDNPLTAFFGMDLCYDRGSLTTDFIKDYNGTIAASHWRTQGDFVPRRYRFNYDNANRIVAASFSQLELGQWSNQQVNFSIRMGDGVNIESAYDLNGNIRSMEQWGIRGVTREVIDSLRYTYMEAGNSNRLLAVQDWKGDRNSGLGDFLDWNTTAADYTYDNNGNLKSDANKGITDIVYNHLNLPQSIAVRGKGTIVCTYDAAGVKLRKRVIDSTRTPARETSTLYLGGGVFQNDTLQFIEHEEGRIRYAPGSMGAVAPFQWDYFIKDHLGNVRMVITEEFKTDPYQTLTFENTDSLQQNLQWDNRSGQAIGVGSSRIARPGAMGDAGTNGNFVTLVRRSTGSIGATKLLKVMSGDSIHTRLDYFYHSQHDTSARNTDMLNKMVQGLVGTLGTEALVSEALKNSSAAISSHLLGRSDLNRLLSTAPSLNPSNSAQTAPRAYLCVLFFDEQFRFDSASSRVVPVPYTPGVRRTIDLSFSRGVPVRKNGYAYLYFTNESNELVYFDNFQLSHSRGPILEETHYYPYGMAMAGISSKEVGKMENRYRYNQGTEYNENFSLGWYETPNRIYDPQIGKFLQVGEFSEVSEESSPFSYGNNNPVLYNDPLGLFTEGPNEVKTLPEVRIYSYSNKQMFNLYWELRNQNISITRVKNDPMRDWLQNFDVQQKFKERVYKMTREEDMTFLKYSAFIGSFFIPGGALMKIHRAKFLLNLFQGKRGIYATRAMVNTATQGIVNGKDADVADIITGTTLPGVSSLGAQVMIDWSLFSENRKVPEVSFINKNGGQVGVDAFTGLVFFGLGKLPVTAKPLSQTQNQVKDAVNGASEAVINKVYQSGLQQN